LLYSGTKYSEAFDGRLSQLGGMSLHDLLDYHRRYVEDVYVLNWNRGVDWKFGGFANSVSPGNEPDFRKKNMYYQGRAIWMFSYLYNHITKENRHLEAAVRGVDFLQSVALVEGGRWISVLSREGKPLSGIEDHYGDIYMMLGLTELYLATKDDRYLNLAINTAFAVKDCLLNPAYQHVGAAVPALEPGTRRLGDWTHFLHSLTALLKVCDNKAIEYIARYCVRTICERHWQPKERMLLELLDDKFRCYYLDQHYNELDRPRMIYGWHAIQASWMVMEEAKRVNHYPAYRLGIEMGVATMEDSYTPGEGMVAYDVAYNPSTSVDGAAYYPWGALDDILVYCLMVLEQSHEAFAIDYYNSSFRLYNSKPNAIGTAGLLHTPRRFFYSIAILERIIERGGKVSGFFD